MQAIGFIIKLLYVVQIFLHSCSATHQGKALFPDGRPVVIRSDPVSNSKEQDIRVVYEDSRSACHDKGQARQCMPLFNNIAEGASIVASSTCGEKDTQEQFCRLRLDHTGLSRMHCDSCSPSNRYSTRHLTDQHQVNNETYWVSGPVTAGQTINLTLSLGKTFVVYYISLQPYGPIPDAVALYKSSDFGKTWQPWQYFSTDCYRAFQLPTSNEHYTQISVANIQEVLCVALPTSSNNGNTGTSEKMIAFSTTIGRPASQPWSAALINWMTMTDLRISLTRFSEDHGQTTHREASELLLSPSLLSPANILRVGDVDHSKLNSGTLGMSKHVDFQSDGTSVHQKKAQSSVPVRYAFADLSVGGRCKCNGHANRCVRDRIHETGEWGPLRCDCLHNTAGTDCENCAPGYLDLPWARATAEVANECKRCDCNLHSKACVFSQQIYLTSLKTSGGVCQNCEHNTIGRRCHDCAIGYYRDWKKPVSHEEVCLECQCHPIGSLVGKPCDRKTGQCVCKPGVIGQDCNRCQDGYKQTRMSEQPCVPALEHFAYRQKAPRETGVPRQGQVSRPKTSSGCPPCKPPRKRIRFKKFCQRDAVFLGKIESFKTEQDKIRFEVRIQDTWRVDGAAAHLLPRKALPNLPPYPIWAKSFVTPQIGPDGRPLRCFCPELKPGQTHLFLTKSYQIPYGNRMELMLDNHSMVLPWRESWRRRLNKFVRRANKGRCHGNQRRDYSRHPNNRGTQFRHVQRMRAAPGFYSTNLHANRPQSFRTPVASSHSVYGMAADQATPRRAVYPNNPRAPSKSRFTYYEPYRIYSNKMKKH